MLRRCYQQDSFNKHPEYQDCYTCEEWYNFQNFAEWYYKNYYEVQGEDIQIDKDILIRRNRIYSPETCILVPQTINLLFVNRRNYRGDYPIGVSKSGNKFTAMCGYDKKVKQLGSYKTPEEAFLAYKEFKENHIKNVADRFKDVIPEKLYNALYTYEVNPSGY